MIFCFPTWNHRWETKKTYFSLNPGCLKGILKMVYDHSHITGYIAFHPPTKHPKQPSRGQIVCCSLSSGRFGQFSVSRPSNELVALGSGALGVLSCADLPKDQGGWMWVEKNHDMSGSWKLTKKNTIFLWFLWCWWLKSQRTTWDV